MTICTVWIMIIRNKNDCRNVAGEKMNNKNAIYKKALLLAVPMMVQNGITNAVSLVDNLMVGRLGTESMTAVSIAGQLIFVFNLAIFGGISGPGIYGAQYYGQGNTKGFQDIFRLKLWICILCALAGIAVFFFGGSQLISLYLHGTSADIDAGATLEYSLQYLHIMLLGLIPFSITQVYASSLRETGESMKPMIAGVASVVVDVVFNYFLIYGKFGFPRLGVRGAAIATVLARVVEMTVVIVWSHAKREEHTFLKEIYRTMKLPMHEMGIVIRKGIPIFLNEFLWAGGIAVLTQCYSIRGLQVVAGLNISNAICNLLNVVFVAMGNAVGILIGQYLGASKFEEAKRNSTKLMWFTGAMCLLLTGILVLCSRGFPALYDTTPEVKDLGRWFIVITALFFPVQGFLNVLYFTLRSGGKTVITFLFDSVFTWVIPVPVAFVLSSYTQLPILGVYAIVQSMDMIKVIVGYILVKKGVWITNLVDS